MTPLLRLTLVACSLADALADECVAESCGSGSLAPVCPDAYTITGCCYKNCQEDEINMSGAAPDRVLDAADEAAEDTVELLCTLKGAYCEYADSDLAEIVDTVKFIASLNPETKPATLFYDWVKGKIESELRCGDVSNIVCEDAASSGCFSADNTLELADGATVTMDNVRVGDVVHTPVGLETVIGFTHSDNNTVSSYVTLGTDSLSISLTPDHFLYVNGKLTPAADVKLGDLLNGNQAVTSIEHSWRRGLFVPVTWSGSLLVSGVSASVHVGVVPIVGMDLIGIPSMYMLFRMNAPVVGLQDYHPIIKYPRAIKFWCFVCVPTLLVAALVAIVATVAKPKFPMGKFALTVAFATTCAVSVLFQGLPPMPAAYPVAA